ncbi:hypothetical protein ACS4RR_003365 [Rhizobium sp. Z1P35]|uniref:hypothetical protein n=1 Tax=Rhizobium sp. SRDI969 TaxID=3138252 RepID=UPI0021A589FD|nr:hypothetical protein [Rhizobium leguminosarum]UWM81199.1 hypothetical protein N2A41_21475 [Rhizobium leguminosarum bv. viciae]
MKQVFQEMSCAGEVQVALFAASLISLIPDIISPLIVNDQFHPFVFSYPYESKRFDLLGDAHHVEAWGDATVG